MSCAFGSPYEGDLGAGRRGGARATRLLAAGVAAVTSPTPPAWPRPAGSTTCSTPSTGASTSGCTSTTPGAPRWSTPTPPSGRRRPVRHAVGGLGGSPFAHGAGGNLATEELVALLDDLGVAPASTSRVWWRRPRSPRSSSAARCRAASPTPDPAPGSPSPTTEDRPCPGARSAAGSTTPTRSPPTAPACGVGPSSPSPPCRRRGGRAGAVALLDPGGRPRHLPRLAPAPGHRLGGRQGLTRARRAAVGPCGTGPAVHLCRLNRNDCTPGRPVARAAHGRVVDPTGCGAVWLRA